MNEYGEKTIYRLSAGALLVVTWLAASPGWAHHSTAMFDTGKEMVLKGVVTDYQWTNPHVWIELDVETEAGPVHYSLELGAPRSMQRNGWKVRTLKPGDTVEVTINPLKNGEAGLGVLVRAKLPDGTSLEYVRT
jgi:hypothetical protein